MKRRGRNREEAESLLWGDEEDQAIAFRTINDIRAIGNADRPPGLPPRSPMMILLLNAMSSISSRTREESLVRWAALRKHAGATP